MHLSSPSGNTFASPGFLPQHRKTQRIFPVFDFESKEAQNESLEEILPGLIYRIPEVLSSSECDQLIKATEKIGYWEGNNAHFVSHLRTVKRVDEINHEPLTTKIWDRLKDKLPTRLRDGRVASGIHKTVRFGRYVGGEFFKPHYDGCKAPQTGVHEGHVSEYTIVVYLSDGFEGGATRFIHCKSLRKRLDLYVKPEKGGALIFQQRDMLHEGCPVRNGKKYIVQSAIMFTSDRGSHHQPSQGFFHYAPGLREKMFPKHMNKHHHHPNHQNNPHP